MSTTITTEKKSINTPDEVREMPNARLAFVKLGDTLFGRMIAQPGWKWSDSVKPIAQTDSCEFPHQLYVVSGALHVKMDDGTELDLVAGDVAVIAPGHDAWVVGNEPCEMVDFGDDDIDYATPPKA
jgi:hypothetical protein